MLRTNVSDSNMSERDISKAFMANMAMTSAFVASQQVNTKEESDREEQGFSDSEEGSDQEQGQFSQLPPSSAALAGHHLIESQNALVEASVEKRELAVVATEMTGITGRKMANRTAESIRLDAAKQFVNGATAIGGAAITGGFMYMQNIETKKNYTERKEPEAKKAAHEKVVKSLKDANAPEILSSAPPATKEAETILNELKDGTFDPTKGHKPEHLDDAARVLAAQHKSARIDDPSKITPYSNAVQRHENLVNRHTSELSTLSNDLNRSVQSTTMIKDAINGALVQGVSGLTNGTIDIYKAEIEKEKVLNELANRQLNEDRRLFADSASKYQGDGSKALSMLEQIRSNNRYG